MHNNMQMNKWIIWSALCLLVNNVFAQQLTAKDAIFTALDKNFKMLIAKEQIGIAQKNNTWSEAGVFPTVTLSLGFNTGIQDNRNNPFTFLPGVFMNNSLSPNLALNYNIFSGFAVKITKERLEQLEAQSKGNALVIIESTVHDVLKAYYSAKLSEEKMKILEQIKANSSKRLQYYEIKEKYAKSSSLELLQFQNQLFTDSTNYLLQKINHTNALRNLLLLMNNSEEPSKEALPSLSDPLEFPFPELNLDQALNDLKSNNQQLKNQYIAQELQQNAVELQKSFLFPTLSFQAGFSPTESWIRNLQDDNMKANTSVINYSTGFNLRYNLFNNFKNKRAFEVAKIQEEIASMNTESMYRSLSVTMVNLFDMYKMRDELVKVSTRNMEYAQKAWDLAQKRFENGTLSSVELLNFQNAYQNTVLQHYDNLFNKLDTFLEIYKLSGGMSLEYGKNWGG
jgi:outer membrane protein